MSSHSGWSRRPLSEFVVLQRGFDLPYRDRVPGPIQVLSSGETSGWHNEARVAGPGFVVGRATNIGRPTWSDHDYWPLNTVLYAKDFLGNEPKFAYYWFLATDLTAYNSGSVQPMLNRNYIAQVPVDVPPLDVQRGIAATLGALDDKIESNRRVIDILEEILRLRFRVLKMTAPTKSAPLADVSDITKGVSYKSADLQPSRTSLVTLKSFDRAGGYKVDGLKPFVGKYKPEQIVETGEIVVAQTDLTQGAEVVGRAVRVPADSSADTLVASLDLVIIRPRTLSREYLLGVVTDEDFRQHCRSRVNGTTVLHLSSDAIPTYEAPIASPEVVEEFTDLVRPLLELVDSVNQETRHLASLRDALLPELLSGRIHVPEAEQAMAEVGA